jgi:hypothetical protein
MYLTEKPAAPIFAKNGPATPVQIKLDKAVVLADAD